MLLYQAQSAFWGRTLLWWHDNQPWIRLDWLLDRGSSGRLGQEAEASSRHCHEPVVSAWFEPNGKADPWSPGADGKAGGGSQSREQGLGRPEVESREWRSWPSSCHSQLNASLVVHFELIFSLVHRLLWQVNKNKPKAFLLSMLMLSVISHVFF